MRRILLVSCIVVIASAGLTACGDDDEERLSKADFLEQGNAICDAGNEEVDKAFASISPDGEEPPMEDIVAMFEDTLIPSVRGQIDDLRALNPPADLEDDVNKMLDDASDAIDEIEARLDDDPDAVFDGEDPFEKVNAQAAAIGLTSCAED